MRPTSRPQSGLRYPLDYILGTEGSVRVVRVVMLSDVPVGVSELARLTGLQVSGVARICTSLEDLNVLEAIGRGARNRQYRRSNRFPFYSQLFNLFLEERNRADQVIQEIRTAVDGSGVESAWIEGPAAAGEDRPGDAINVAVLVSPADVESVRRGLWQQLLGIQSRRGVVLELEVFTLADLKTAPKTRQELWQHVRPLRGAAPLDIAGVRPETSGSGRVPQGHEVGEARSKSISKLIAEHLQRDPSLVEKARDYIERRIPFASPGERLELTEWQDILATMSISRLRRFLVEDSPRAKRLRQSLPFFGALSEEERNRFFPSKRRRE